MHGSCLLMKYLLESATQQKPNVIFQILEEIVSHILWIMSEPIKRGHCDPSQGDDSYNPGKVIKLVISWMMSPQIVGFDCFGGRKFSCVQIELKVNRGILSNHVSSTNIVQCYTDFVCNSTVLYDE